jgi:hypothetical protein
MLEIALPAVMPAAMAAMPAVPAVPVPKAVTEIRIAIISETVAVIWVPVIWVIGDRPLLAALLVALQERGLKFRRADIAVTPAGIADIVAVLERAIGRQPLLPPGPIGGEAAETPRMPSLRP